MSRKTCSSVRGLIHLINSAVPQKIHNFLLKSVHLVTLSNSFDHFRSSSKNSQLPVNIYNFLIKCANQIKLSQSNSILPVRLHLIQQKCLFMISSDTRNAKCKILATQIFVSQTRTKIPVNVSEKINIISLLNPNLSKMESNLLDHYLPYNMLYVRMYDHLVHRRMQSLSYLDQLQHQVKV